jgi:glycosyltransferase involved in cell wall biosynthesis
MDLPNLQATETFYNVTITNPDLLPIPVSISEISANKQIEVNGALKILWVGRLCDFKVPSLLKVWDDLRDALQVLNLSVEFTVVGSGPLSSKVASFAKDQPYKICLVGEIPASDISAVMVRHDLVFAMGTSALEAAASGVPCCCLDASYSQLPKNYRYRWVHECRGFGLGWIMDKNSVVPSENQWAMIDLLREVVTNWAGQQRLCYDYAESNHNVASLSENLISRIGKTSLLLGDLEGLKRRDPIRLFWRWLKNVPFAIRKILSTGSRMIE